jgi:hypothetical protein
VQVIRQRTIIRHESVTVRHLSEEITVLNDGKDPIRLVNIEAQEYRPGLSAFDADGTVLPIMPNSTIRSILEGDRSPESQGLLESLNSRTTYVNPVALPEGCEIQPGDYRVIRLEYSDTATPGTEMLSFLSIPTYKIQGRFHGSEGRIRHFVVIPPTDFELGLKKLDVMAVSSDGSKSPITEDQHHHKTVSPSIIDVAIPVSPAGTDFALDYAILPGKEEGNLFRLFWVGAFDLSAILLVLGVGSPPAVPAVRMHFVGIGGVIFALCIGFIGLVTNPVTHRTKLWMVAPMILAGAMIAIGYG